MNKSAQVLTMMEAIMPGSVQRILGAQCPSCGKNIDPSTDFRDDLSLREYHISGLCQECQDSIWNN